MFDGTLDSSLSPNVYYWKDFQSTPEIKFN